MCDNCSNDDNINNTMMLLYNEKMYNYITQLPIKNYIIEITKCCGYSEFVIIDKDMLLCDVYRFIGQHFGSGVNGLYVFDHITGDKLLIPNHVMTTLRQFVAAKSAYFRPVYPMETKVVYKIYFDDGCCHVDHGPTTVNNNCTIHSP